MKRLLGFGLVVMLAGCSVEITEDPAPESTDPPLSVYVVNYPLQYFAQRIGGDAISVTFPAPSGLDPAFWVPDPDVVADYQSADLILLNGARYARWVERVSLSPSRMVDTSRGFADRLLQVEGTVTHTHGPGGEHAHAGTAFTTWLDPTLALEQARAIHGALAAARPDDAAAFDAGLAALEADLEELDARIRDAVGQNAGQPLVMSHSIYQYLANRYGWNVRSVQWEPDQAPDEGEWRALEMLLAGHPARWMIWEGSPLPDVEGRLESMGVGTAVFAPAFNVPEGGTYLDVMDQNVKELENVFEPAR